MGPVRKITLIEPEAAGFHVFSPFKMPRLGLPLLGAILDRQGYNVQVHMGHLTDKYLHRYLDSDLIGISITTSTAPEGYRLADSFRRLGKTVVIGGVHATFVSEEALEHSDYVVRGEAEDTFPELIRRIQAGERPDDVPGVSFRDGDRTVHNPRPPFISDLDRLPFPDYNLIKPKLELSNSPLQTSRGCPFPCNFCNVTQMFGRKVRFRSVDHVLDEIAQLPKDQIFYYDDNFCVNPNYTKELCEGILRRGLVPQYSSAQVRADIARDPELLELLYRSGCKLVYVGFESINPETLKEYHKKQTVEQIASAMDAFRRFKIRVHGMFVLGSDHDTIQTAQDTLRFALQQRIETVQFMMLTPIPGTELHRQWEAEGRIFTRDWTLYDAHHAVFFPKMMEPEELQKATIAAMSRFYSLREGFRGLARVNFYVASRRFMGWYFIKRWKRQNRGWGTVLHAQKLKAHRTIIKYRLEDIRTQLNELLGRARNQVPALGIRLEELRQKGETYLKEISRISKDLMSALEEDLGRIEKRTEELTASVRKILDEFQALDGSINTNTLKS